MANPHQASTAEDRRGIAHAALYIGTPKMAEFWHLQNTTMQFAGRGSEVALNQVTNFDILSPGDQTLEIYTIMSSSIMRHKSGELQILPIYPHRDFWEEDWYLSITYHYIMMSPGEAANAYIFPNFARQALKTSNEEQSESKVASYWKECFQEVFLSLADFGASINQHLTSHCGKKGVNQHLAELESVSPLAQIFRSGWEVRNVHSLFDYIVGSARLLQQAGKGVSNWTTQVGGRTIGGIPPTLMSLIDDPERELLEEFIRQVFKYDTEQRWRIQFRVLLLGALFRHYDDMVDVVVQEPTNKYQGNINNHRFFATIHSCLQDARVSNSTFLRWRRKVKDTFLEANFTSLPIKCFEHLKGTPDDPLVRMNCDPRSLMDNYNQLVTTCHQQAIKINQLSTTLTTVSRTLQNLQEQQGNILLVLTQQNNCVAAIQQSIHNFTGQPILQKPIETVSQTHQCNTSVPVTPEKESMMTDGVDQGMEQSENHNNYTNSDWEARDPTSIISYSLSSQGRTDIKTLVDHFVFFFENDIMLGFNKDMDEATKRVKELQNKDKTAQDQLRAWKKKLTARISRTKKSVRLLLFFLQTISTLPKTKVGDTPGGVEEDYSEHGTGSYDTLSTGALPYRAPRHNCG